MKQKDLGSNPKGCPRTQYLLYTCWLVYTLEGCTVWSALQAGQFSTRTLLLRSHAVVIAAVCGFALSCWNTQGLPWNRHCLEGSICCSKTFIYLSAFIVPSKTCKLPILYALMHLHTINDAGFWTQRWVLEVFLGPFSNVNDRIMPMSDAVSSEGPKTTGIQQMSSASSLKP